MLDALSFVQQCHHHQQCHQRSCHWAFHFVGHICCGLFPHHFFHSVVVTIDFLGQLECLHQRLQHFGHAAEAGYCFPRWRPPRWLQRQCICGHVPKGLCPVALVSTQSGDGRFYSRFYALLVNDLIMCHLSAIFHILWWLHSQPHMDMGIVSLWIYLLH